VSEAQSSLRTRGLPRPTRHDVVVSGPAVGWRYRLFGRSVPAVLYTGLGILVALNLERSIVESRGHGVLYIVGHPVRLALYLLFCTIPVVLFLTRPVPTGRDGGWAARAAAFGGTLILVGAGAAGGSAGGMLATPPTWLSDGAAALFACFTALEVYALLRLRTSFSIIPEARRLVTDGPYSVVRNPLYAAEIAAALAWTASEPRVVLVAALLPFIGLQLLRIRFEERLLRKAFPDYAGYFARTRRLVPFVW